MLLSSPCKRIALELTKRLTHQCYANADKLGGEVSKFFCIGSSLGAGIALGTSMMLIDNGHADKNRGVVAICPAAMHPRHVPDEFKPIYKAYDQTWTGTYPPSRPSTPS